MAAAKSLASFTKGALSFTPTGYWALRALLLCALLDGHEGHLIEATYNNA